MRPADRHEPDAGVAFPIGLHLTFRGGFAMLQDANFAVYSGRFSTDGEGKTARAARRWDRPLSHPFYSKVVKRILDFVLAVILLIPGCVIMLPLAVWVKLDSPGPVIYKAVRGGYHNKPFMISIKFRSMVVDADKTGGCTALNDSRVTRAGRIMRRLKLDELPQLFNIVKGDMSFIGPRPGAAALYDPVHARAAMYSLGASGHF